ncbi:branched-chain amino acid ABC transporter permease [Neobacillus niacini]|uniref:branched-chain amino acid ABC transporter permease n=1 Tax=Neobacillus niacini TaxID=86668 RepID=UPI002FFFCC25
MPRIRGWSQLILVVAVLIGVPMFINSAYHLHVLIMIGIYAILAAGLNLIVGYAGQLSIAHAAFFGVGAYTAAVLVMKVGISFWLALPLAGIMAGVLAYLIGLPAFRTSGIFLSLVTMGFGGLAQFVFHNARPLTGGPDGITGIPFPSAISIGSINIQFGMKQVYFVLVWAVLFFLYYFVRNLAHSRIGEAFVAVREDEDLARALGINVMGNKLLALVLSAIFGGVAGGLYAHYMTYVSSEIFTIDKAIQLLAMVIVGGAGTVWGPLVGAALLTLLPEVMRFSEDISMIVYGLVVVMVVIFMPNGITGLYEQIRSRIVHRPPVQSGMTVERDG